MHNLEIMDELYRFVMFILYVNVPIAPSLQCAVPSWGEGPMGNSVNVGDVVKLLRLNRSTESSRPAMILGG